MVFRRKCSQCGSKRRLQVVDSILTSDTTITKYCFCRSCKKKLIPVLHWPFVLEIDIAVPLIKDIQAPTLLLKDICQIVHSYLSQGKKRLWWSLLKAEYLFVIKYEMQFAQKIRCMSYDPNLIYKSKDEFELDRKLQILLQDKKWYEPCQFCNMWKIELANETKTNKYREPFFWIF